MLTQPLDTVPAGHSGHLLNHITPITEPLYVVMVIDNPEMYAARYRHYHTVEKHVEDSGAIPYTVEVAIGDRHFEVTEAGNPQHIQLRAKTELWRKENLQNIGVGRLPHGWKYVALCDADMINTRADWVQATIQALQRYDAVQLFSTYSCLKADYTVESTNTGFVYGWSKDTASPKAIKWHGAPGGAWAYRRPAWDAVEGMLQTPILGSADRYMTQALVRLSYEESAVEAAEEDKELKRCAPQYIASVHEWTERAKAIAGNIWYVENHAIHYWHGPYKSRGYGWRWKILATHAYDPDKDLKRELSGLLELRGNKPGMRDEIRAYFRSRNEDAV